MKCYVRKRAVIGLLACALLAAFLVGCGRKVGQDVILYDADGKNGKREKISLTFLGFKADATNLTAIEAAMQSFMSEHKDIDIAYEGIKGATYWDVFDKRDDAGVLDDVIMMHHDHVISMSAEGKLLDLSDLPGLANYTDEARGQFTNPDGSVYFLPTQISTYNLYINYDLLESYGQAVPENWGEFKDCCDFFVGEGIVPIIANNRNSLPTLITGRGFFDVYQQADVADILLKFNEDPSLVTEALAPGVEQVAEMLRRGWIDPVETLETEQTSDDLELFLKGDRPFMVSGGWATVRVMAREPGFSYGIHPYPILEDGSVLSIQVDTCISINAESASIAAAKEFVNYLIEPDVMWAYCDSQASYTPLKEEGRVPSEKTLAPSMEYLTNGRTVLRSEYRLTLPMETALFRCAETLLKGGTAAEALAVLDETLAE